MFFKFKKVKSYVSIKLDYALDHAEKHFIFFISRKFFMGQSIQKN